MRPRDTQEDTTIPRPAIVITGAGLVTCLGLSRETTWRAILDGRCGFGSLTALEQPLPLGKDGGQAVDLPNEFEPDAPREVRYLNWAIADALRDAGALDDLPYPSHRCGFMLGTTLHGMRAGGKFFRNGDHASLRDFLAGSTLARATKGFPLLGPATTTCSACSSSLGSIALAVTLLRAGALDLVVAGGYDTISEYVYGGFNSLRLVADGPLKPFSRDRQGMKLAEGYGIVVLERAEDATRRSVQPLATILGCGESADAHHLTQPHPQGDGAARAISAALHDANLSPSDINLIAAHATGTADNDAGEYAALKNVFGEYLPRVPVVGFKSHLGHTLGGAGAVELILSAMSLRDQIAPSCANVTKEEIEFAGLNVSTDKPCSISIRTALNTSLGFGGANTCVILGASSPSPSPLTRGEGRGESSEQLIFPENQLRGSQTLTQPLSAYRERGKERSDSTSHNVYITGIGVVFPGVVGNEAFVRRLALAPEPAWRRDAGGVDESEILSLLNARRVRRMSEYVKLTLAATALAFQDASIIDIPTFASTCPVLLGSTHGSTNYSVAYYRQIVEQGLSAANPMLFAEGVPNAAAAHLSLMFSLKGACQTVIGTRTAGLDALRLASLRIAEGQWDRAIVGAGEEYDTTVNAAYRACGVYKGNDGGCAPFTDESGFTTGAGAVTFILESRDAMERRGAKPRGRVDVCAAARSTSNDLVDAATRVLINLGRPTRVMSSANATWVDRAEIAALRHAECGGAIVSSLYGYFAETFSVTPFASIASVLLSGAMPALQGDGLRNSHSLRRADGQTSSEPFAVLCTDATGLSAGARVSPL